MSEVKLQVAASGAGWWVDCDLPLEATYFQSGAHAQEVARRLAIHLSGAGHDVELWIRDRAEQLVATHLYFAL